MGNTKQELRIEVEKFIKDTIGIVSPRNVCWSKLDLNSTENKIRIEIIVTVNDPLDTKSINFSEHILPAILSFNKYYEGQDKSYLSFDTH